MFAFKASFFAALLHKQVCYSQQIRGGLSSAAVVDILPRRRELSTSGNATCAAHPKCADLGLEGHCCPTLAGATLDCCLYGFGTCETTPGCKAEGLEGSCCPTKTGQYLDCCTSLHFTGRPSAYPSVSPTTSNKSTGGEQCSDNPLCAAKGLVGNCCPADDGTTLDCCDGGTCQTTTGCAILGLEGSCCPTKLGTYLDCCHAAISPAPTFSPTKAPTLKPTVSSKPTRESECSAHPKCLGLAGNCCPTDSGTTLDCCEVGTCETTPACAAEGLMGSCCPTTSGVFLDCCSATVSPALTFSAKPSFKPISPPTVQPTASPTPKPTVKPTTSKPTRVSSCSANPSCHALGLKGECCPAANGKDLFCCSQEVHNASCAAYPSCATLAGNCCPTVDGTILNCCIGL